MSPILVPIAPQVARKPAWPIVIGIVSLCLGGVGLLKAIVRVFMLAMFKPAIASWYYWLLLALAFLDVFIILLLPLGGVLLIQRKPAGRRLLIAWSCISLAILFLLAVLLTVIFGERATSTSMSIPTEELVLAVAHVVTGGAYPVFLLIWMSRRFAWRDLKDR